MGGSGRQAAVAKEIQSYAVYRPDPQAAEAADQALDLLAGAFADLLIADARAEVAADLGVAESSIDRERGRGALPTPGGLVALAGGGDR